MSKIGGEVSHLRAIVDELTKKMVTVDELSRKVADHESRIQLTTEGQLGLSAKISERGRTTQRWVEYDGIMKTRFMSLAEDGSDWEPWALIYWYRWCLRQTSRADPVTSWGDYKVRVQKAEALIQELGSIIEAKDYLEYAAFRQENLTFHQVCAGGWVGKLSPQVRSWIEDKVAEQVLSNSPRGQETAPSGSSHPIIQRNLRSWEQT